MTTFRESWEHIFGVVYWEILGERDIRQDEEQLTRSERWRCKFIAHLYTARTMAEYWWLEVKKPSLF